MLTLILILEKLTNIENLLKEKSDDVLTFKQACKHLDLSASYLYMLTSTKQIPHYKPRGKRLFFSKSELDKWLLRNRLSSISESIENDMSIN